MPGPLLDPRLHYCVNDAESCTEWSEPNCTLTYSKQEIYHSQNVSTNVNAFWRSEKPSLYSDHACGWANANSGSNPGRATDVFLFHRLHADTEAQPASYSNSTERSFPWNKAAGAWSWPFTPHLVPCLWMNGAVTPLPYMPWWRARG